MTYISDIKTHRQQVLEHVAQHPDQSAYEISKALGIDVANISSLMKRLVDQGVLRREKGGGPKGGYTYYLVKK